MSRQPMEPRPLPPEVAALLAAERRAPAPSAARQAQILSRLQAAVTATGAATASAVATSAAAAVKAAPAAGTALASLAAVSPLAKPLLVLAVTTSAAAIGGGVALHRSREAKSQRATVTVSAPGSSTAFPSARRVTAEARMAPPENAPPAAAATDEPPPRSPLPALAGRGTAAVAPDIEAEADALEQARLSLVAGDAAAALARVQWHARRFPRGVLTEEREALWIRALLRGGDRAQAERRAAAFARKYPASVQTEAIARALREIP